MIITIKQFLIVIIIKSELFINQSNPMIFIQNLSISFFLRLISYKINIIQFNEFNEFIIN